MPRLFSGIEIPADVRLRLSLLRGEVSGARWIAPDNLHVTLRFLGDIDGRTADEFADLIADVRPDPFAITVKGLGSFGGRSPRAIWAGIEQHGSLAGLAQAHERAARMAGLEPETRAYLPHVTMARLRGARPEPVARFLEQFGDFAPMRFEVGRIVIFSSRPGGGGGPYAVEEAFALGSETHDDWDI